MGSLLDTLGTLAPDPAVVSRLRSDLTGLADRAGGLPTDDIRRTQQLVGQISLPDERQVFGDGVARLTTLVDSGLPSADALRQPLTDPLSRLESSLTSGLRAPMTQIFDDLRGVGAISPTDAADLVGPISEPLQRVASVLAEAEELQRIQEFIAQINELSTQITGAPAALATLLTDQVRAALEEATVPVASVTRQLSDFVTSLETQTRPEQLQQQFDEILLRLVPEGGTPIVAAITTLDFAADEAFAEIDGQVRTALMLERNLARATEDRMAQAAELIDVFEVDAWAQRLASAAQVATSSEVSDLASLLSGWRDILMQAQATLAGLSLDNVLRPVRDVATQINSQLEGLDLQGLKTELGQGIQSATSAVNAVNEAQLDVLAGFQSLVNDVTAALDAVDLATVVPTVENALNAVDPALNEVKSAIDKVSEVIQSTLSALQSELSTLHTSLTDPNGAYRAPIEAFLNSVQETVPDDIPETFEEVGERIGTVVAALEEVALDPAFDAVIEQLNEMRAELERIDVASLSPLLRAALAAALEVFKTFDFQQEVEEALTGRFDEAIAAFDEAVVERLQHELENVLAVVRANDPSLLFERLGITQAFDEMLEQAAGFRPSEALTDLAEPMQQAIDRLDSFTPTQVLQPVVEPLVQLQAFIGSLSLAPLFAQFERVIDDLVDQVSQLDIAPFVSDLNTTVAQLRDRLDSALSVEGLLGFFQPIHQAIMDALDAVDPAALLQTLTDVRQTLLEAIDAVDTTALTGAFSDIAKTVGAFEPPRLRSDLSSQAQSLSARLGTLDLPAKITQLQTTQQALKAALEARGEQADQVAEDRRQTLLATVEMMAPLPLFASVLQRLRTSQSGLTAITEKLDAALSEDGPVAQSLEALSARLHEIAPTIEEGVADIKQVLRDAVAQAFEAVGLDAINQIYAELKSSVQSYSPENVEAALEALIEPLQASLQDLLDPSEVLEEVVAAFDALKALIDPGLHDFLSQLQTSVEPVFSALTAKVGAIDPEPVLAALEAKYEEIVAIKDRLQDKVRALFDGLDVPYRQIEQMLQDLNPREVLVAPLSATHQAILDKFEGADVRSLFQPLLDALKKLRDALIEGINRTGSAFASFLSAAPSVSASVSL